MVADMQNTHMYMCELHTELQKVKGECIVSSYTMFNFIAYIAVMIFNLFLISSIISGFFSFGGLTEKGHPFIISSTSTFGSQLVPLFREGVGGTALMEEVHITGGDF